MLLDLFYKELDLERGRFFSFCLDRSGIRYSGVNSMMISYEEAKAAMSWAEAVEALKSGHGLPRAEMHDLLFGPAEGRLMTRAARIERMGYGVKAESIFHGNARKGLPNTHGAVLLYHAEGGMLRGVIDSRLITDLKTAADSVLGGLLLARSDSRHLVIVGAGRVAENLAHAYSALFPSLKKISVWARRFPQAEALGSRLRELPVEVTAVGDLAGAAATADILSAATMAEQPLVKGAWIRPGTHVDLVGAFTAEMREADDALIAASRLYVDCRQTTFEVGEIAAPIASGAISKDHVLGDLYDLVRGQAGRVYAPLDITTYKNGGGAHLDLMIADGVLKKLGL